MLDICSENAVISLQTAAIFGVSKSYIPKKKKILTLH